MATLQDQMTANAKRVADSAPPPPKPDATEGMLQNLSNEATKSRDQVVQDQLAGIDQNKSFAPTSDEVARQAAESGGPPNSALAEALGRKKQKIYGQGLEQLKAQAAFESSGRQLTAQQKASAALQQNQQVKYRQAVNDYKVALNKKKQENGILMSAIQFGGTAIGMGVGGALGGSQGAQMGAQVGGAVGSAAGGLTTGSSDQEGLD